MKFKRNKKLLVILLTIFLSYISINKFYITFNCKIPEKALEYHSKNNDIFKIKEIFDYNLIFSSDDLMIYEIETITKKDFEFKEFYTIKLKKIKNTWKLDSIEIKN
ncbi:MAG: hypothetical protein ACRCWG_17920 [Sarcina sp.]